MWSNPTKYGMLADCAKAKTGNHYDPSKACGPASEYVDTPACAAKVKSYSCTPAGYKANYASCEAGDLSGKFGGIMPNAKGKFKGKWVDPYFPSMDQFSPQWNIVFHAVCGPATPRVACAQGFIPGKSTQLKALSKDHDVYDHPEHDDGHDGDYDWDHDHHDGDHHGDDSVMAKDLTKDHDDDEGEGDGDDYEHHGHHGEDKVVHIKIHLRRSNK